MWTGRARVSAGAVWSEGMAKTTGIKEVNLRLKSPRFHGPPFKYRVCMNCECDYLVLATSVCSNKTCSNPINLIVQYIFFKTKVLYYF